LSVEISFAIGRLEKRAYDEILLECDKGPCGSVKSGDDTLLSANLLENVHVEWSVSQLLCHLEVLILRDLAEFPSMFPVMLI
jgi:hypothetical protein